MEDSARVRMWWAWHILCSSTKACNLLTDRQNVPLCPQRRDENVNYCPAIRQTRGTAILELDKSLPSSSPLSLPPPLCPFSSFHISICANCGSRSLLKTKCTWTCEFACGGGGGGSREQRSSLISTKCPVCYRISTSSTSGRPKWRKFIKSNPWVRACARLSFRFVIRGKFTFNERLTIEDKIA